MLVPKLYGRLGNQMFQIAFTIALAKKYNLPYHIPYESANPRAWPSYFWHLKNTGFDKSKPAAIFSETGHGYNTLFEIPAPHLARLRNNEINLVIDGYFQSYKYFDWCRQDILEAFNLFHETIPNACAIHVRRGDYLLYPTKHPVVTGHYIMPAVKASVKKGALLFTIFSDDMPWCMEFAAKNFDEKIKYVPFEGPDPLSSLQFMSNYQIMIISNSSYSWWAAYLNQDKNKVIFTPHEDNWFGPDNKHLDVSDLLPPDWIRIKY